MSKKYTSEDVSNLEALKLIAETKSLNASWWRTIGGLTTLGSLMVAAGSLWLAVINNREDADKAEMARDKAEVQKVKFENENERLEKLRKTLDGETNLLTEKKAALEKERGDLERRVALLGDAIKNRGSLQKLIESKDIRTLLEDVLYPIESSLTLPGLPKGLSGTFGFTKNGEVSFAWHFDPAVVYPAQFQLPEYELVIISDLAAKTEKSLVLPKPDFKFRGVSHTEQRSKTHYSAKSETERTETWNVQVSDGVAIASATNVSQNYQLGKEIVSGVFHVSQFSLRPVPRK